MNVRYIIGIALVVIGLVSLLLGGFRWTEQKTVVDVGPLKATTTEHKTLPIPPVAGALALVGGIVLLVVPGTWRARS
jgi:drug/metabolite transporter (DMT)-like permease